MNDKEFKILGIYNKFKRIAWSDLRDVHTATAEFMDWADNKDNVQMVVSGINAKLESYNLIERIPRTIEINQTSKITQEGEVIYLKEEANRSAINTQPIIQEAKGNSPAVFLSYSWANSKVADEIDNVLLSEKIILQRDIRDIKFTDSIKDFMKRIGKSDFVLMLISEEYIKSENCMHEVTELLNSHEFEKRILPILLPNAKVFDRQAREEYYDYWKSKCDDVNRFMLKHTDEKTIADKKKIENIYNNLGLFFQKITDLKSETFEEVRLNKYNSIKSKIGLPIASQQKSKDIPTIPQQIVERAKKAHYTSAFIRRNMRIDYDFLSEHNGKVTLMQKFVFEIENIATVATEYIMPLSLDASDNIHYSLLEVVIRKKMNNALSTADSSTVFKYLPIDFTKDSDNNIALEKTISLSPGEIILVEQYIQTSLDMQLTQSIPDHFYSKIYTIGIDVNIIIPSSYKFTLTPIVPDNAISINIMHNLTHYRLPFLLPGQGFYFTFERV